MAAPYHTATPATYRLDRAPVAANDGGATPDITAWTLGLFFGAALLCVPAGFWVCARTLGWC